ncbi:MAG: cysteine peptidase family C39 domain-containing protein [Cytophagales bacterium]|nr:cysteine peptidase family C39 domain-containing protein [Cytophagales bacterium]
MENDKTFEIIKYAFKKLRIRVTADSLRETLQSLPDYPTMKSVSDTMTYFGIEHYPLKLTGEELRELLNPFLVHISSDSGEFVWVESITSQEVKWRRGLGITEKVPWEEFEKQFTGGVILIEPEGHAGESGFEKKKQGQRIDQFLFPVGIVCLILLILRDGRTEFLLLDLRGGSGGGGFMDCGSGTSEFECSCAEGIGTWHGCYRSEQIYGGGIGGAYCGKGVGVNCTSVG